MAPGMLLTPLQVEEAQIRGGRIVPGELHLQHTVHLGQHQAGGRCGPPSSEQARRGSESRRSEVTGKGGHGRIYKLRPGQVLWFPEIRAGSRGPGAGRGRWFLLRLPP